MARVFQGFTLRQMTKPQVGLDAKRPANPKARDIYVANDTGNIYYCRVPGKWEVKGAVIAGDEKLIKRRMAVVTKQVKDLVEVIDG